MTDQITGQTSSDILPDWLKPLPVLNLEDLVDELFRLATEQDAASALDFWDQAFKHLRFQPVPNKLLRGAAGRLVLVKCRDNIFRYCNRTLDRMKIITFSNILMGRENQSIRPSIPQVPLNPEFPSTYTYYATMVALYGSLPAQNALHRGELVLLGLRKQSSTLANKGLGSYDDQIIVLKGSNWARTIDIFPACTEPGAQYSQRAKAPKAGSPYGAVKYRKTQGVDINNDGIKDAGRLIEGTYKYFEKTGGYLGARAFEVNKTQIAERDTNGDGFFTKKDPSRIDKTGAGTSMYIHRGGADNVTDPTTWSAGCQTIPKNVYNNFLNAVGTQGSGFYYVLVNTR